MSVRVTGEQLSVESCFLTLQWFGSRYLLENTLTNKNSSDGHLLVNQSRIESILTSYYTH